MITHKPNAYTNNRKEFTVNVPVTSPRMMETPVDVHILNRVVGTNLVWINKRTPPFKNSPIGVANGSNLTRYQVNTATTMPLNDVDTCYDQYDAMKEIFIKDLYLKYEGLEQSTLFIHSLHYRLPNFSRHIDNLRDGFPVTQDSAMWNIIFLALLTDSQAIVKPTKRTISITKGAYRNAKR